MFCVIPKTLKKFNTFLSTEDYMVIHNNVID